MAKTLINPDGLFETASIGASQATVDDATGLLFVSGQVGWNLDQSVAGSTVEAQLQKALSNLHLVLDAAGASVETLLRVRVYVRGELGDSMEAIMPVLGEFLGESRPALTGIGVASLATPETLVEVEAVASTR